MRILFGLKAANASRKNIFVVVASLVLVRFINATLYMNSYELHKGQNSRTAATSVVEANYDANEIIGQGKILYYQSNSCWSNVFEDLSQMKERLALDDGSTATPTLFQEIDSCFFFSREHRRYLALQVTNCHLQESGRPSLSENCSSSIVRNVDDTAATDKFATCMSQLEWQTYTHFYLSIETICGQLQKESFTKKLHDLSKSKFVSKSFEEGITAALNNLAVLHSSQVSRDAKIKKSKNDQIRAQQNFESSIESFIGEFWASFSCSMLQSTNLSTATRQLGCYVMRNMHRLMEYAHISLTCSTSLTIWTWKMTIMKFGLAIIILLSLTSLGLLKRARRKVTQVAIAQLLIELSLVYFRAYLNDDYSISLWLRWTNMGCLVLSCCILLVVALIASITGCRDSITSTAMTESSDSKLVQNNMDRIIDFQKGENDRMIYTMMQIFSQQPVN